MEPTLSQNDNTTILYDSEDFGQLQNNWFDSQYWIKQGLTQVPTGGRGSAWIVSQENRQFVLRHYSRGGLVARFNRDCYIWSGLVKSRPWREWHTLSFLYQRGIPVPQPLAFRLTRHWLCYRADIITRYIPQSLSLADRISQQPLGEELWGKVGQTIRKLHHAEVLHADLNAHNILVDESQGVFLIDFDKADKIKPGQDGQSNLDRLLRSLRKIQSQHAVFHFSEQDWQSLLQGYGS